jgi:hypothetical protein
MLLCLRNFNENSKTKAKENLMGDIIKFEKRKSEAEEIETARAVIVERIKEVGQIALGTHDGHAFIDPHRNLLRVLASSKGQPLDDARAREVDNFYSGFGVPVIRVAATGDMIREELTKCFIAG